jgi:hypothetical protein
MGSSGFEAGRVNGRLGGAVVRVGVGGSWNEGRPGGARPGGERVETDDEATTGDNEAVTVPGEVGRVFWGEIEARPFPFGEALDDRPGGGRRPAGGGDGSST